MDNIKVSIIITALNEEKNVFFAVNNALRVLEFFNINGEIIFINDGSVDKTEEIVRSKFGDDQCIKIIKHDYPHGIGASFWEGVDKANGEIVTWLPGDNQTDPFEVLRYYSLLEHVDIVIPFIYNTKVRSLGRRMLSIIFRFIINTTFSTNFNYTNGSILYRKSIFNKLSYRSSSFFFQTDILIRLTKKGCLFAEVPFRLGERNYGVSKAVTFPSFVKVIRGYFRLIVDLYLKDNKDNTNNFSSDTQTAKRNKELRIE